MSVSAIIVTYRTGPTLWECLAAAMDESAIAEIVIVDNGNPEAVALRLRELARARADVVLVQGQGNVGFAAACNLGARAASGANFLFLNPDAVLAPGAVPALVDAAGAAAHPCIIGGVIYDAAGREQRGARRGRVTPWSAFVSFTGLARFERASPLFADVQRLNDPLPDAPARIAAVSGALMLIPRADFEALGGFDTGYFLHVEDIDICRRAEAMGGGAVIQPRARAQHAGATSDAPAPFVEWHKAKGFLRYFRRTARGFGERALAELAGGALLVMLPLRALLRRKRSA